MVPELVIPVLPVFDTVIVLPFWFVMVPELMMPSVLLGFDTVIVPPF